MLKNVLEEAQTVCAGTEFDATIHKCISSLKVADADDSGGPLVRADDEKQEGITFRCKSKNGAVRKRRKIDEVSL